MTPSRSTPDRQVNLVAGGVDLSLAGDGVGSLPTFHHRLRQDQGALVRVLAETA
jgi:hypothetical protein